MDKEVPKLTAWAKEVARSGDPRMLGKFRARLIDYLDIQEPCPEPIFAEIQQLLKSSKLASHSEYGNMLSDLAISDFAFTDEQKRSMVDIVEDSFLNISQSIARMQACHLFIALQLREAAAQQFLRLLRKADENNAPHAELIWELVALARDEDVSLQTREIIKRALPRKA